MKEKYDENFNVKHKLLIFQICPKPGLNVDGNTIKKGHQQLSPKSLAQHLHSFPRANFYDSKAALFTALVAFYNSAPPGSAVKNAMNNYFKQPYPSPPIFSTV